MLSEILAMDFSKDIDFSADVNHIENEAQQTTKNPNNTLPQQIDYNEIAKKVKPRKIEELPLANPISTLCSAAELLKLDVTFEWLDCKGRKTGENGQNLVLIGPKVCIARVGECEARSKPFNVKKECKADACAKLLPEIKSVYGDWNQAHYQVQAKNKARNKNYGNVWKRMKQQREKQNKYNKSSGRGPLNYGIPNKSGSNNYNNYGQGSSKSR